MERYSRYAAKTRIDPVEALTILIYRIGGLGRAMNLFCPGCGVSLGPDSRFCHACGVRILERAAAPTRFVSPLTYTPQHLANRILTSRSTLEGEHKRVTVLFCDIANSTALAERLGDEQMYKLLNRFFDHALAEVHHYEGSVNQFLGDGFMALFGAPLALEHHERRAVLASLGIRRRLKEHFGDAAETAEMAFEVRMGLNTGQVVVGKIGDNLRMDYTAVGDTTHIAARLQAMAAPGEVLIAKSTFEHVHSVIDTRQLAPLTIKGKSQPLEVHRVVGVRFSAAPSQAKTTRNLSRFVGREREIAELLDCLDHAAAGRGQAVGIVSEPGMGKTRLVWEFRQRILQRNVGYLEGQCLSYGAAIPYLPILDVVRVSCQILESDTPSTIREKVRSATLAMGLDEETTAPYLLDLLGVQHDTAILSSLSPEVVQSRTFKSLRQLCLKSSQNRPLVLVVEDLHWVDRTSEDFLALLAESLAGLPILLLATYRPGYSPAWINKSYATQISLRPLSESGGMAIVQEVLASEVVAQALATDVVTRAEGNPLFLEELARAVSERVGAAPTVPDTLFGVLSARIDRLPEKAKHLLQIASVIGREFSRRLLAVVWEVDDTLESELARLVRLEFIYERTFEDEIVYVFKHALTREAAYASLLSHYRQSCHGKVGTALERLHVDRIDEAVEILAYQFGLSAYDEKAVDYAIRASDRAQARWANTEALAFSEQALRRLQAMPVSESTRLGRIDVVIKQAEVRFALGQHAAQLTALAQIGTQISSADEPSRRAAWHYWTGFLNIITGGRTEISITHCEEASSIAKAAQLEDLQASADSCLAQVYVITGEPRRTIKIGEHALDVFERRGNRWWASRTLSQLIPAANALGEWQRSLSYCARALEHGIATDDLRLKVSAYIRFASTQIQRGDWRSGLDYCDQAKGLAPVQYDAAALRAIRGYGFIKAGRAAEGTVELAAALVWYDQAHLRYTQTLFTTWLAEGYLRSNERQQAQRLLQDVLATSTELGYRHLRAVAHRLLAECLRDANVVAAADHLRQALEIIELVDSKSELAKTWLIATSFANGLVEPSRRAAAREQALSELRELGTVDPD